MRSTVSRKSTNFAMINGARQPPRPTPSMVNYSDEDSAKGYDENPDDSDSLTEKPLEISSIDSQEGVLIGVSMITVVEFHSHAGDIQKIIAYKRILSKNIFFPCKAT